MKLLDSLSLASKRSEKVDEGYLTFISPSMHCHPVRVLT